MQSLKKRVVIWSALLAMLFHTTAGAMDLQYGETTDDTVISAENQEEETEVSDSSGDISKSNYEDSNTVLSSARAANRTQAEAIQWVKSKVGQSIDADGVYGAQCVDLILAYYDYLGVPRSSGNGADYTCNALPGGWSRIQGAAPQPGDILVYTGGYGHVAIYESDYSTYHQNFNTHSYVERVTIRYNGLSSSYWGVIRPNWYTAPVPADLGDHFTAIILKRDAWKPIQNTGNNVELCTERGVSNEKWLFQRQGDGAYVIQSCFDGKVLDVYNAGSADNTNVWVYPQGGADNTAQQWFIYWTADDNRWKLVPKCAMNLCLDVYNDSSNDGANVQIHVQNNSAAQQFAIYKLEDRQTVLNGISITADRTEAKEGESIQLKAVFNPVDTVYNTVRWTSEDESIATVDANGKVTSKKAGTVTIRCNNTFNADYHAKITLTFQKKATEGWKKNSKGWWYQNADGSYPKNSWKKIGNKWYHFDANGYMQTNWQKIGSKWYYFDAGGVMKTGWQKIGLKWYYLDTNGAMKTGWQKIGVKWYFFHSSGDMALNKWISNKYYVKSDGSMAVNEWVENGKYYVDGNGVWVPGKVKVTEGWKKNASGWWYQNADGSYPKNSWKKVGNHWYHFNANGYMQTGWLSTGSNWYYLDTSGRMVTNQWIQGKYYMKSDGTMARNEWIGKYHVDKNGKWDATR